MGCKFLRSAWRFPYQPRHACCLVIADHIDAATQPVCCVFAVRLDSSAWPLEPQTRTRDGIGGLGGQQPDKAMKQADLRKKEKRPAWPTILLLMTTSWAPGQLNKHSRVICSRRPVTNPKFSNSHSGSHLSHISHCSSPTTSLAQCHPPSIPRLGTYRFACSCQSVSAYQQVQWL